MRLIDADKAQAGTMILAAYQMAGRGQRGNSWQARPGECLMMSLITIPASGIDQQFIFSALVATTIANVIKDLTKSLTVQIKWPNDLIINDKKAGGILIENVLRGHSWLYAVIGFGLNVLQDDFGMALPNATSLKAASGETFDVQELAVKIRTVLIENICNPEDAGQILARYNELLFQKGKLQLLGKDEKQWTVTINQVLPNGQLEAIAEDGSLVRYTHGEVQWVYQSIKTVAG